MSTALSIQRTLWAIKEDKDLSIQDTTIVLQWSHVEYIVSVFAGRGKVPSINLILFLEARAIALP